jgi:hypothetical protein
MTQRKGHAVWELAMGWKNCDLPCCIIEKARITFVIFFHPFVHPFVHPPVRPFVHLSANASTVSTGGICVKFDIDDFSESMSGHSTFG